MYAPTSSMWRIVMVSACTFLLDSPLFAQAASVELLITDAWRNPVDGAKVHLDPPPVSSPPAAISDAGGRCFVNAVPQQTLLIDHELYAPRVVHVEQSDIDRGYLTATLYEGGGVRGSFSAANKPVRKGPVLLRYADPEIYPGFFEQVTDDRGDFRFSHMPEGLGYLTLGVRSGGALRTVTRPVQIGNEGTDYVQVSLHAGTAEIRGRVLAPNGAPSAARLSGTFVFDDGEIEDLAANAEESSDFVLGSLPVGALMLRAILPTGELKRIDVDLSQPDSAEQTIDFSKGSAIRCTIDGVPPDSSLDVFLLDGRIEAGRVQARTDRARYTRGARAARLDASAGVTTLSGIADGEYTALAMARLEIQGRVETLVTAFVPVSVSGTPVQIELSFENSE